MAMLSRDWQLPRGPPRQGVSLRGAALHGTPADPARRRGAADPAPGSLATGHSTGKPRGWAASIGVEGGRSQG